MTSLNDMRAISVFTDEVSDRAVSAIETDDEILRFVRGLRGPRKNPVSREQILGHMARYPMFRDVDIERVLSELTYAGKITCTASSLSSRRKYVSLGHTGVVDRICNLRLFTANSRCSPNDRGAYGQVEDLCPRIS